MEGLDVVGGLCQMQVVLKDDDKNILMYHEVCLDCNRQGLIDVSKL